MDLPVAAVVRDIADAGVHLDDARERRVDARAVEQVAGVEADAEPGRTNVVYTLAICHGVPTTPSMRLFCSASTTPRSAA
jgi:hypothetical protein